MLKFLETLAPLQTELSDIPPLALEILSELDIFGSDGVLADVGEAEDGQGGTEDTQTG